MSATTVREISPSETSALKSFVTLERRLVGASPWYVSEIDEDVIRCLSGRSRFFDEMDHTLFVASQGSEDTARCAALINRRYQTAKNEPVGFIGYFAAAPENETTIREMLAHAESWLSERGVSRVIAPCNGAAILGSGLRTAAFDEDPMFPFPWQPSYYAEYFVAAGYEPTYPMWHYTVEFASEGYRTLERRAAEAKSAVARPIDKKRWDDDLDVLRKMLNETFEDEWEFHPHTIDEFHEFFDPMKPVLDPRQILIGEIGGKPAGFCLGMPDWSPLFRSFRGKVGPIQLVKLMLLAGRYRRAGLLGIGVLPEAQGTGLAHALAAALYRRYQERGLDRAFYYPVNEINTRSRKFAESIGGTGRVLYHCYDKSVGQP